MRYLISVCLLSCLPFAALAETADDNPQDTPAREAVEVKEDKVLCKRIKVTGSHMRQRVCQKRSVWKAQQEASQESVRRILDQPNTAAPG